MKKALIICEAGMSSSLIAKKGTDFLKSKGHDIEVDAVNASAGVSTIQKDEFDMYLVSPQTKMRFKTLQEEANKFNKPTVNIPPQAYIPIPMGIEKFAKLVLETLGE